MEGGGVDIGKEKRLHQQDRQPEFLLRHQVYIYLPSSPLDPFPISNNFISTSLICSTCRRQCHSLTVLSRRTLPTRPSTPAHTAFLSCPLEVLAYTTHTHILSIQILSVLSRGFARLPTAVNTDPPSRRHSAFAPSSTVSVGLSIKREEKSSSEYRLPSLLIRFDEQRGKFRNLHNSPTLYYPIFLSQPLNNGSFINQLLQPEQRPQKHF